MPTNRSKSIGRLRRAYKGRYKRPKFSVTWSSATVRPVLTGKETVSALQAVAKSMGIKGYSKLKKDELAALVGNSRLEYSK